MMNCDKELSLLWGEDEENDDQIICQFVLHLGPNLTENNILPCLFKLCQCGARGVMF